MAIFPASAIPSAAASGFEIPYSCRFNSDDSTYLHRTPASASNRTTFTLSYWVKICEIGNPPWGGSNIFSIDNGSSQLAGVSIYNSHNTTMGLGGTQGYGHTIANRIVDGSGWRHHLHAINTSLGGSGFAGMPAHKWWINGRQVPESAAGAWSTGWGAIPNGIIAADYADGLWNLDTQHEIGSKNGTHNFFDGYLAEIHFLDGTAVTDATDFGEYGDYSEWKPIETSGLTYGTNGYYLDFADSADLGKDVSGETNHWTSSGLDAYDQMIDTPTNNFCVLNYRDKQQDSTEDDQEDGNLHANEFERGRGTFAPSSGKWYWEVWLKYQHHSTISVGISEADGARIDGDTGSNRISIQQPGSGSGTLWTKSIDGTSTSSSELGTVANDDIWGVALNIDDQEISFTRNGSAIDAEFTDLDYSGLSNMSQVSPYIFVNGGRELVMNFGQDSSFAGGKTSGSAAATDGNGKGDFYYTPPTDYLALCSKNLPEPIKPKEHFSIATYTGNSGGGIGDNVITGVGFQPDLIWFSAYDEAYNRQMNDSVRGVTKVIESDTTTAEQTSAGGLDLKSFDSDGFTLGASSLDTCNLNGTKYIAWCWKAGNATLGTGDFTQGNADSTCSRNVDAGFSIVSYTGNSTANRTVGHGLSKAPEMIIIKNRDDGDPWMIHHFGAGTTGTTIDGLPEYYMLFFSTAARTDYGADTIWGSTATTFMIDQGGGGAASLNLNTEKYIAYCFHSVEGFSKVGHYKGNGEYYPYNGRAPFVYTGFLPEYIMIKRVDSTDSWHIKDNQRDQHVDANTNTSWIMANDNLAQTTGNETAGATNSGIDYFANGFLIGSGDTGINASGGDYVYIAFAKQPFKYANSL